MNNLDNLWKNFEHSGKICDYLAFCAVKEAKAFGDQEGTSDVGRTCDKGNECGGE